VGEGLHRQFVGAVDELPDQGIDDPGLQVQAFFQEEGGDVLVAQMPPAVALFGHLQEGGHDVRHHPVDVEGQAVEGDAFNLSHHKGFILKIFPGESSFLEGEVQPHHVLSL